MSEISETGLEILRRAESNHATLMGCSGHEFVPHGMNIMGEPSDPADNFRCLRCGGLLDTTAHHWYTVGVEVANNPSARKWIAHGVESARKSKGTPT